MAVQQIQTGPTPPQQVLRAADVTNADLGADEDQDGTGTGTGSGTGSGQLLDATGAPTAPAGARPLGPVAQRVADAVNNVSNTVKGALGLNKPKAPTGGTTTDSTPAGG